MFRELEALTLLRERMSLPLLGDVPHTHSFYSETYILVSIVSQSKPGLFSSEWFRASMNKETGRVLSSKMWVDTEYKDNLDIRQSATDNRRHF